MQKKMTIGGVEFDLRLTFLIVLGTILPMLDYYKHYITGSKAYDRVVLYFIIPMIIILLLFKERPSDYGFRLGNWREGLLWVGGVAAIMAVILLVVARVPSMQTYYQRTTTQENIPALLYISAVDLWGWEFIWRGFLLFGFARILGPGPAIFLQAVPFAFMHLGKPEVETITTIFGGAGFGFIAWRTNSFLYPFLIHWFIVCFTRLLATGRIG